jgi:hypothetical protein
MTYLDKTAVLTWNLPVKTAELRVETKVTGIHVRHLHWQETSKCGPAKTNTRLFYNRSEMRVKSSETVPRGRNLFSSLQYPLRTEEAHAYSNAWSSPHSLTHPFIYQTRIYWRNHLTSMRPFLAYWTMLCRPNLCNVKWRMGAQL